MPSKDRTSCPKTCLRKLNGRKVYETEVESEPEQDDEEEDVPEEELSFEEDDLVEGP